MNMITGHTRIVGIFGDPVEHTLSPTMHNAGFQALGLDMAYVPFHVRAHSLKEAVEGIRAMNMKGMNITIPHKEAVLEYLDDADEHARDIGAVNSIVNRDGRLIGYNTDGPGYLLSLREETGFTPKDKSIVILGAGGAARSIFYTVLGGKPSKVTIANRTPKRAEELAGEFTMKFRGVKIAAASLEAGPISEALRDADLLVNTTSLGMMGKSEVELPFETLPSTAIVSDIVYRPLETGLLLKAREHGLRTHNGVGMLVRQGAITFELWTGRKAPLEVMRRAVLESINAGK